MGALTPLLLPTEPSPSFNASLLFNPVRSSHFNFFSFFFFFCTKSCRLTEAVELPLDSQGLHEVQVAGIPGTANVYPDSAAQPRPLPYTVNMHLDSDHSPIPYLLLSSLVALPLLPSTSRAQSHGVPSGSRSGAARLWVQSGVQGLQTRVQRSVRPSGLVCLSGLVRLSVCLCVCLCLSVSLPLFLSVSLFVALSYSVFICLLSFCLHWSILLGDTALTSTVGEMGRLSHTSI